VGRAREILTLLILALLMASGNAALGVFATVQEAAKAEFGLSDTAIGLIQGLATSIPLALLSIPVGLLVDRSNRVRLLALTSLAWSAGTLLTAWAPDAATLFVARTLAGLGANISTTIGISLAADLSAPERRGRTMLLLTLGKYAGSAAAFTVGGLLFGTFARHGLAGLSPWRSVHLALGFAAAALTFLLLFVREPVRREQLVANAPVRVVARELWSRRAFLLPLFVGQTSVLMADAAAAVWAAPVLARVYHLSPTQFGGWMGLVILSAGVVGALLGGFAADWGSRRNRRGAILIGAVVAAAIATPASLFPLAPSTVSFAAALGLLLLGGTVTGLVTATAIAVLLPNEVRGLCVGAFVAFGGLIAFGASPPLVTGLSAWLGGERFLAPALAAVGLAVSLAGLVGFVVAWRRVPVVATR
jgi:MFS family permease